MNGIQSDDVVAARRSDGLYEIRQVVDGELVMIRLGVYDRPTAEKIAIELAKHEQSQAGRSRQLPPARTVESIVPPWVCSCVSSN